MQLERSEKFAEDLEKILIYIAKDSKPSAHRFLNELYETLYSIEPYLFKNTANPSILTTKRSEIVFSKGM